MRLDVTLVVPVRKKEKLTIPLVGWHDQSARFEDEGQQWELTIAGGCQAIYLKRLEDNAQFVIEIGDIVGQVLPEIKDV